MSANPRGARHDAVLSGRRDSRTLIAEAGASALGVRAAAHAHFHGEHDRDTGDNGVLHMAGVTPIWVIYRC